MDIIGTEWIAVIFVRLNGADESHAAFDSDEMQWILYYALSHSRAPAKRQQTDEMHARNRRKTNEKKKENRKITKK